MILRGKGKIYCIYEIISILFKTLYMWDCVYWKRTTQNINFPLMDECALLLWLYKAITFTVLEVVKIK